MIYHGGDGSDTLRLSDSDQTMDLTDSVLTELRDIEVVDVVGASPNTLVLDRSGVIASTDTGNTLVVVHDEDDTVDYVGDEWFVQAPIFLIGGQRHLLTNLDATVQTINTRPWTNPLEPSDVNFSGKTTALDALQIINFLGRNEALSVDLATPTSAEELPERYYDVNESLNASALDALLVINFLARQLLMDQGESIVDSSMDEVSMTTVLHYQLVTPYQAALASDQEDVHSMNPCPPGETSMACPHQSPASRRRNSRCP